MKKIRIEHGKDIESGIEISLPEGRTTYFEVQTDLYRLGFEVSKNGFVSLVSSVKLEFYNGGKLIFYKVYDD